MTMANSMGEDFYIGELKKTQKLVDDLVLTLKEAHPHIQSDIVRTVVGNMIMHANNFKQGD